MIPVERWIMRWWPAVYAVGWTVFAIVGPEPWLGNWHPGGHITAAVGACGLVAMLVWPSRRLVRFWGTLVAIVYPVHRAAAIALDEHSLPSTGRRIVAVTTALLLAFSLLVVYPMLWYVSDRKRGSDAQRQ